MGVTQGAVAQHVRKLEQHLGIRLFDRLPHGLALTSVGRGYHARVAQSFSDLRMATAQLKPAPSRVLMSVTPTFAAKWLIPNLPAFTAAHPDIDLQVLATEKLSSFHSDRIDLAVRQGAPPFGASLNADLLFKQDVIAVAAPSLLKDVAQPVSPSTLAALPKIHDTHDIWPKLLADAGIANRNERGLRLSQTALAVDAAIAGQGVALVSRFFVATELADGKLIELGYRIATGAQDFYLISPRKSGRRQAVQAVTAWLLSQAQAGG